MSFWGAQVITGLFGAIPVVGEPIRVWLLGGFSPDGAALNRFFALHYLLPFVIVGVAILHVWAIHITIGVDARELASLPADIFAGRLSHFEKGGEFTGTYRGPDRGTFEESFETNLARIFAAGTTPRLSGVQIKAPMYLGHDGTLLPATELPFTHILKPAGASGFEQMPVVEWLCLEQRMARALRALSTDPNDDIATLFARALFTWLVADGDMHLKKIAMLKIAAPRSRAFESVRMAPLDDTLTTRVFPGLHNNHMALKLAGKDDRPRWTDFETCARAIDLPLRKARDIADHLLTALGHSPDTITLPRSVRDTAEAVLHIVRTRHAALAAEL